MVELETVQRLASYSKGMSGQALINGNFDVWQRGTTSGTMANMTNYFVADRWKDYADKNGGTLPTLTRTQGVLSPGELPNAFYYSRLTTNGAGTSLGASSYHDFMQTIEHGTRFLCGAGKTLTVSFYARSSIANKKLGLHLQQRYGTGGSPTASEEIVGTNWTLTSSWVKYTHTFTTNTLSGKTFGTANDDYLFLRFAYIWGTTTDANVGADGAETYVGSGTIDIAQVQLCAGSEALPFDPKDFDEEYQSCLRYYQKGYTYAQTPALNTEIDWRTGAAPSGSYLRWSFDFPVEMRITPTVTTYGIANANWDYYNAGWVTLTTDAYWTTAKRLDIELIGAASYNIWLIRGNWAASAEL